MILSKSPYRKHENSISHSTLRTGKKIDEIPYLDVGENEKDYAHVNVWMEIITINNSSTYNKTIHIAW